MSRYLSETQIEQVRSKLELVYSLPYSGDLVGTAWEDILAEVKGGAPTMKRDNRPRPDIVVPGESAPTNYSVKTESLRLTVARQSAADFLGSTEDLIVARPQVDLMLPVGQSIASLSADQLGQLVLRFYNERIVDAYAWHALSILLRVGGREFIYWEESPVPTYRPDDYWWRDSGKAAGSNRNINGYPESVGHDGPLPPALFKWTSGGKQFYVRYRIPHDADTWRISPRRLTMVQIADAIRAIPAIEEALEGHPEHDVSALQPEA